MSKLLSDKEAEEIVNMIRKPLGLDTLVLSYLERKPVEEQYRLCRSITRKEEVGFLWWKKTIEFVTLKPVYTGPSWEDCIDKMHKAIQTTISPRIELADKFREKYMSHLLDEELRK